MAVPNFSSTQADFAHAYTTIRELHGVVSACPVEERSRWETLAQLFNEADAEQVTEIHLEPDEQCWRLRKRSPFNFTESRLDDACDQLEALVLLQHYLWQDDFKADPVLSTSRRGWFSFKVNNVDRLIQLDVARTSRGDTYLWTILQDTRSPPARLSDLALTRAQQDTLRNLIKQNAGLILLASRDTQSRVQTARAIAQELVAPDKKIVCADLPGHPLLPRISQLSMDMVATPNQRQAWPALCDFNCDAIVACQDLDDEMTRQLARHTNESTLVVQALPVSSAADAINKLLSTGVRSEAIARSLSAIVVQHRLQCLCTYCRGPYSPDDRDTAWLAQYSPIREGNINDWLRHRMRSSFSHADGCDRCNHTGRGGILDLYCILTLDDDVRDALYDTDVRFAMTRLKEDKRIASDLLKLAQEGIITLAEAARIAPVSNMLP